MVVLRCAVTRKLRQHWREAHERSTIYKWMELLVDTSIVHAVLYMQGMQSIVRERIGALALYIF